MNKTRMILAATGGVTGVAVLAMAYFVWSAYAAKTAAIEGDDEEGVQGLESVQGEAAQVSHGKVYPCLASVKGVESNTAAIVAWRDEAVKLAARGDRPVKVTTPAQFKNDIVEEAKRIANLPGAANGKLVKSDFTFGPFKPFIAEGQMPTEAKLAELTRRWDDVVTVVDLLVESGITELVDVQFKGAAAEAPKEEAANDRRKKGRRVAKKVVKEEKSEADGKSVAHAYVFSFTTRAPGLVKAVNALTTGERFIVVDNLTFVREKDVIADALGDAKGKAEAQQASGGRRGRRGRRAVEEQKDEKAEAKSRIITDPLLDAPIKATLTVTVHDFRSMEETKAEEKTEEKKGEAK